MIPKKRIRPKMGVREPERLRSPGHLAHIRSLECSVAYKGPHCSSRMEAHHVSEDGNAGMGIKCGDDSVVPLCASHHTQLHRIGRVTFESAYGVDLSKIAAALWQASPARKRIEAKERAKC